MKYLLEVSKPDKAEESKHERKQVQEYTEIDKSISAEIKKKIKIRQQIKRSYPKVNIFHEEVVQTKMENIISAYMNYNTEIEYVPSYISGMICLLGPLVYSLKKESDIFWSFQALMKKLEQYLAEDTITDKMSRIMMYLRSVQPELFNYFEEEELSPNDWAMSWLSFLLAKELPLECVLRLWDTYFSYPDGFEIHIFVCIAILVNCSESLMELDISELKSFLQRLPSMDMDEIISQAYNIRDEVKHSNL